MNKGHKGLLIAFEGIDGSGKTSHIPLLAQYLRELGHTVVETREPTDGTHGKRIRSLLSQRHQMTKEEELELFLLDRRDHVQECINPALAAGHIILTDRYYFSTAAYQGAAGGDLAAIFNRNAFAPEPDLVLLLTISADEGIRRIREGRGESPKDFEQKDQLEKVAALFASFPQKYISRINGAASLEAVQAEIRHRVRALCQDKGLAYQP